MPDAVKPEICLTGKLLYPIHIGLPAYIQETDGYRRTSTVCAILADTQEATVIETRNSVYSIQKYEVQYEQQYRLDHPSCSKRSL